MRTTYTLFGRDIPAAAVLLRSAPGRSVYLLSDLSVAPGHRRCGYASELLDEVVAVADREGATLVVAPELSVEPGSSLTVEQVEVWMARRGFAPGPGGYLFRFPAGVR